MIMISIDNNNILNASYQTGTAVIDISEYLSKDSIEIKMYGIDKCGTRSNQYVEIAKLGTWIILDTLVLKVYSPGQPLKLMLHSIKVGEGERI